MPCFYCLDSRISISMCLGCRTKLENAKDDIDRYRREAKAWERKYWQLINERKREIGKKMRGKP